MGTAQASAKNVTGTGNTTVLTGPGTFRGYSIREAAGSPAAAAVRIWDGTSAAGTLLAAFNLAASGSSCESPADGIRANLGIFVEVVTGTVEGSVRYG